MGKKIYLQLSPSFSIQGGTKAPPPNPAQGVANLTRLTTTAQFYRQDALPAPNLTHPVLTWPTRARHCSDREEKTSTGRAARVARRPPGSFSCCHCSVVHGWARLAPGGSG